MSDEGPGTVTSTFPPTSAAAILQAQQSGGYLAQPNEHRRVGKVRSPWGVWGLTLITLGIYSFFWWYKINREIREYDSRIQVDPGIAVIALCVPIASLVTLVKTGGRIERTQRFSGIENRCSGGLGLLFSFLLFTHVVYYQSQLNKVWAVSGNQPPGTSI